MRIPKYEAGFTLVEIMIVVAIIALLAAIAIPNLLRAKMSSNDALAQSTLRALSTSAEAYGIAHNGDYPGDIDSLTGATPPYVNVNYCTTNLISGYTYDCSGMLTSGYIIIARPASMGITGSTNYTITSGGVLSAGGNY